MKRLGVVALAAFAAAAPIAVGGAQREHAAPVPYTLTELQAQEVALATQFVNAFNARNLRVALGVFAPRGGISDCDYRHVRAVEFRTKSQIATWLRQRFADRDYLGLDRVLNGNADDAAGAVLLGYAVRRSRTLRRLGFAQGIKPRLLTKVRFTLGRRPLRISAFANGPIGGSPELCRPG